MADPRHAPLSFRPAGRVARDEEFDESVFDRAAESADRPDEEPEEEEAPPAREGLPPSYRMRHDAHYVEQIASRRHAEPVHFVPVGEIDGPHALTPPHALEPLVESIATLGILQPLLVRKQAGRYQLIAGARRLAAAIAAGLAEVPCLLHVVDDERAQAMAQAEALVDRRPERRAAEPIPPRVFSDLMEHLGAIGACMHLFGERDRPLRERVAMGLVQAEVQRAAWLAQSLAVLVADPPLCCNPVDLGSIATRLLSTLTPECVLGGVDFEVECEGGPHLARGDEQLLSIALAGMVLAVHAIVERVPAACIRLAVSTDATGRAILAVVSDGSVAIPASWRSRFFDLSWAERPGGVSVGAGIVAARRIAQLHGGSLELAPAPTGCSLALRVCAG